ncbi:MAG: LysM peptidoglycan-binding domain-containing protein [Epulopiscium sp.]|mgnify:CR=1 FL=1|nr:LysM peptidoglycan-binding domain-containing protein [Candidatus Epulonipiscium sp.]
MKSIYYEPDAKKEQEDRKWFKNVKLIGEIDKGTSIYIEDYAYTYLHQCANNNLSYEVCALLIGEQDKEQARIVIYGVMLVNRDEIDAESKWVDKEFTDNTKDKIRKYFPKGQCVGWMHTQPGYGLMATTQEITVHKEIFDEDGLFMLIDPIDKLEAFYSLKSDTFEEKKGFCIYYEKNENMQRYMEDYPLEEREEDPSYDIASKFRELGSKRKSEIESKMKKTRIATSFVAGSLLAASFVMGIYSQKSKIDILEKEVCDAYEQYNEIENRIANNPVELVFTPEELEAEEGPELENIDADIDEETETSQENEDISEPEYDIHVVKMGDSLLRISYNYYDTVARAKEIAKFNGIADYNTIYIGQELKLPR